MINELTLKYGTDSLIETLILEGDKITIFVGPNNSGKSLILREIENYLHDFNTKGILLEEIKLKSPTIDELNVFFEKRTTNEPTRHPHVVNLAKINSNGQISKVNIDTYHMSLFIKESRDDLAELFHKNYYNFLLLRLDGSTRFNLTLPQESNDLSEYPSSMLGSLFIDDTSRGIIRDIIADALGLYFVIDPTNMKQFRIKLANRPPVDSAEEQALDARAREFHQNAIDIRDLSDGVKAFTGIISSVYSGDFKVLLIDEPEAFLHPPLARKLGLRLAQIGPERGSTLFAATHSSDFILGCIQSGKEINIVRLTYQNNTSTAKVLPSSELKNLMRDPLLRSSGVLDSLFHETVIVTESDADRAFYQEINERLQVDNESGLKDALFLNAQNKQTIHRILGPLKKLGIKAAAIVDIDVIKEGGQVWSNLLEAAKVPSTLIQPLNLLRADVKGYFRETGKDMKRDDGINLLSGDERAACQSLFDQLALFGIFVIPNGELESWLSHLNVSGHGPTWLMGVFDKMGSDPESTAYIKPSNGDIWEFIRRIGEWSKTN